MPDLDHPTADELARLSRDDFDAFDAIEQERADTFRELAFGLPARPGTRR